MVGVTCTASAAAVASTSISCTRAYARRECRPALRRARQPLSARATVSARCTPVLGACVSARARCDGVSRVAW